MDHHRPPRQPRRRPRARRRSFLGTLLMIIGAITVLVLLARYVVIPVLVMLPSWLGGAA